MDILTTHPDSWGSGAACRRRRGDESFASVGAIQTPQIAIGLHYNANFQSARNLLCSNESTWRKKRPRGGEEEVPKVTFLKQLPNYAGISYKHEFYAIYFWQIILRVPTVLIFIFKTIHTHAAWLIVWRLWSMKQNATMFIVFEWKELVSMTLVTIIMFVSHRATLPIRFWTLRIIEIVRKILQVFESRKLTKQDDNKNLSATQCGRIDCVAMLNSKNQNDIYFQNGSMINQSRIF